MGTRILAVGCAVLACTAAIGACGDDPTGPAGFPDVRGSWIGTWEFAITEFGVRSRILCSGELSVEWQSRGFFQGEAFTTGDAPACESGEVTPVSGTVSKDRTIRFGPLFEFDPRSCIITAGSAHLFGDVRDNAMTASGGFVVECTDSTQEWDLGFTGSRYVLLAGSSTQVAQSRAR